MHQKRSNMVVNQVEYKCVNGNKNGHADIHQKCLPNTDVEQVRHHRDRRHQQASLK